MTTNQQQQAQAAAATQTVATDCKDIFTLIFPGHRLAVLEVRGANSPDEARAFASEAIPNCGYEVKDGDPSKTGRRAPIRPLPRTAGIT